MRNYNPEILKLDVTTVDVTFSKEDQSKYCGWSDSFYIVPTEMVINGDRDLWKNCPSMVNWDMLQCIREIKANGGYPYNKDVGDLFCKKFNPTYQYNDGTFLSSIVYCTQKYEHAVVAEENAKNLHYKLMEDGFIQATEAVLKEVANTKRKFILVTNYTDFLGNESKGINEDAMTLKDFGAQGLYWMRPRARNTGFKAKIGQYIKEVTQTAPTKKIKAPKLIHT